MIKRLSSKELVFIKNLFLTTILGGVVGVINYLFNIYIARYTDQSIFSIFSSALGVIYILQIPANAIQAIITKGVAQNGEKDLNSYKWRSFFVFSVVGVVVSSLFFLSKDVVAEVASIPTDIIIYLAITLFFAFISPVAKGLLLGLERITTINVILLLETILKFGMGALAIKLGGSLPLLILANALPAILSTIFILPMVKFNGTGTEKVSINVKELFLILISLLLLTAPFTVDLILVNPAFRAEYAAISLLGKLIYFASITTAGVMFARLTNEKEEMKQRSSLMISLALSLSIGLFLSLTYFLFGDLIVDLSVGSQYSMITRHIGVYGLCMTGFSFVYMTANFFISKGYFKYLYILFVSTALQVTLFVFRNDSLEMFLQNQIVVYISLTGMTLVYLLIKLNYINNGKKKDISA